MTKYSIKVYVETFQSNSAGKTTSPLSSIFESLLLLWTQRINNLRIYSDSEEVDF